MDGQITLEIIEAAASLAAVEWNVCAGGSNPFVDHAFFVALEASGSAVARAGWAAAHLLLRGVDGAPIGIMPAYRKSHSQGEYVFDHSWADAFERAGGRYYPKLQCAVPFSPVPGPRLLLRDVAAAPFLLRGAEQLCTDLKVSSVHATFVAPDQLDYFRDAGWLIRKGEQFHWHNRGYRTFDDFLGALSSRKRKMIRKERETALVNDITVKHLSGADIAEHHWDIFWHFYQDTGVRKWGQPYLTRTFFSHISASMAEKLLLVLAYRNGQPIAGALNLIGADTLYGRYWGCVEDHPCLHFEVCYYAAIDYAIAHGLQHVEAGAQGPHKLARGYEPAATWSAHYIAHPGFRTAIADFVEREARQVDAEMEYLGTRTPFRKIIDEQD
jgi:uncharacterized protein